MKKYTGLLLLIIGAFIWGTAFVAQADAAQTIPPFTFSALRSFIGVIALLLFFAVRRTADKSYAAKKIDIKKLLIAGTACGVVLSIAMNLQQYGITVYPEAVNNVPGRSGFLTALYVVLVPLAGLLFKRKVHPLIWLAAALSVFALWLLCLQNGFGGIYLGDVLMFICAIAFSAQILCVDTLGKNVDGILLSCAQFFVAGVTSFVCALLFEPPTSFSTIKAAWLPLFYVGVLSSGIAYTLQILGQQRTEPAFASIVMSLESVFAVLGGWVVFGDLLSAREIFGCVLMFAAVLLAQSPALIETLKRRKQE